jgi:subtilisin family serine protease
MIQFLLGLSLVFSSTSWAYQYKPVVDVENIRLKSQIHWSPQLIYQAIHPVTVAIIDSGVDPQALAFQGKLLSGKNFVEPGPQMRDDDGHGTACAGIILELAPQSEILPLKVTDKNGAATLQNFEDAIVFAIEQGAKIINISMSLGEGTLGRVYERVGQEKFDQVLIVSAAGNYGQVFNDLSQSWENVLITGATNLDLPVTKAPYSNYGSGVDLFAPAGNDQDGITTVGLGAPDAKRLFNGTSAATPVVSAIAALAKEAWPDLSGPQIKQLLLDRACPHSSLFGLSIHGSLLNVNRVFDSTKECLN